MSRPLLSVIVIAYNMPREIPRTIRSLSPGMQREMRPDEYEIVVIDNGSSRPCAIEACVGWGADVRFLQMDGMSRSPAAAINKGLAAARGELVGVMIDGARLASPGLLRGALLANRVHNRAVIASLGFHLGSDVQMVSVAKGYNEQMEDQLLDGCGWTTDAYRLFEVSVFAGSSAGGWFAPILESNALFMRHTLWSELGGVDERFVAPGGGLVNLDTYRRACELPDSQLIVLLGEGTFHQVHGGVATNAPVSPWDSFHEEYVRIRGHDFSPPGVEPLYLGRIRAPVLASLVSSARSEAAGLWNERPHATSPATKSATPPSPAAAPPG